MNKQNFPATDPGAAPAAVASPVAVIVLDSGFSPAVVTRVRKLLGYWDLNSGLRLESAGASGLDAGARLAVLANTSDPLNHGSVVLERLLDQEADLPVVLVRCFDERGSSIKSGFAGGSLVKPGWTEAYLWAQYFCSQLGYLTVANCSFGGLHHAMDGTGWEAAQLSRVTGEGLGGHLVVAACGPGDGRPAHASAILCADAAATRPGAIRIKARQAGRTNYNLWVDRGVIPADTTLSGKRSFALTVSGGGRSLYSRSFDRACPLGANFWNNRQQLTFEIDWQGEVLIDLAAPGETAAMRFDLFVSADEGAEPTVFLDHVDADLVSEPAVFDCVIGVGLVGGQYGSVSINGQAKPDLKLSGDGPISFRTPEITLALARFLAASPWSDAADARIYLRRSAS